MNHNMVNNYNSTSSQESHCTKIRRAKVQSNAISAGALFMMAGGLQLISTLYLFHYEWIESDISWKYHKIFSWFIGAFIGGNCGYVVYDKISKKNIYIICGICMLLSGIFSIEFNDNTNVIVAGRYLSGIAYAICYMTVPNHAAEIAEKDIRGYLVSNAQFCLTTSLFIYGSIYTTSSFEIDILRYEWTLGIITVILSVIGIILTPILTIESPVFFLKRKQDGLALEALTKLRASTYASYKILEELNDLKDLVNGVQAQQQFTRRKLLVQVSILMLRAVYVLSMCLPLNYIFIRALSIEIPYFYLMLFASGRFISELISIFLIDTIGRRKLLMFSACFSSLTLVIIAIILDIGIKRIIFITLAAIFYELFIGTGLSIVSFTYMAECYVFRNKAFFFYASIMEEILIHSITLYCVYVYKAVINDILIAYGIATIQLVATVFAYIMIPETKQLSLKQCLNY